MRGMAASKNSKSRSWAALTVALMRPAFAKWLRGRDLNPRPLGYEPNELPDCSTPRQKGKYTPPLLLSQDGRGTAVASQSHFKKGKICLRLVFFLLGDWRLGLDTSSAGVNLDHDIAWPDQAQV